MTTAKKKYSFDWDKTKQEIVENQKKGGFQKDERFWTPPKDKDGNYNSVTLLRFLPVLNGGLPFIKYFTHSFDYMKDGEKKKYFSKCVSTFGFDRGCPICQKNSEYYKSSFESDKKIAGERGRKLHYVANVLILKCPQRPEDEGKVFLYDFGKQIMAKIDKVMFPKDEDIKNAEAIGEEYRQFVPFDPYEGANFKLVMKPQGQPNSDKIYPNYEDSQFGPNCELPEATLDMAMEKLYDLSEFVDETKYPKNEDVIKAVGHLLGLAPAEEAEAGLGGDLFGADDIPDFGAAAANAVAKSKGVEPAPTQPAAAAPVDDLPFDLDPVPAAQPVTAAPAAAAKATPAAPVAGADMSDDDFFDMMATTTK